MGQPDLQQARLIGFVFEASAGAVMNGAVYIDDMVLVEPGNPMNSQSIRLRSLVMHDGLWGSRSRIHGMVPLNSVFADVGAMNATAVK